VKKYAILVILIFVLPCAYSQGTKEPEALINKVQQLTLANKSLEEEGGRAKDSLTKLKDKVEKLQGEIGTANKKITELTQKIDKKNIESLETQIKQKTDSIKQLKGAITNRDSLIKAFQNETPGREQKKIEEGQQKVYNQIGLTYQNTTLDNLIKSSTKQSVERDLQLTGNNTDAKKKLHDLQSYFTALQILEVKYDDQRLKNVQTSLDSIMEKSVSIDELKKRLKFYKQYSDALKASIVKIMALDKDLTANDAKTQKSKKDDIFLIELASYYHNYYFNYNDYPYLSDIILEIMKLKQKDANADISHLSSKL
jgi:hypothetical protein